MKFTATALLVAPAFPLVFAQSSQQVLVPRTSLSTDHCNTPNTIDDSGHLSRRDTSVANATTAAPIIDGQVFQLVTSARYPDPFGWLGKSRINGQVVSYPTAGHPDHFDDQTPVDVVLRQGMQDQSASIAQLSDDGNLEIIELTPQGLRRWAVELGFETAEGMNGFGNVTKRSLFAEPAPNTSGWKLEVEEHGLKYLMPINPEFRSFVVCDNGHVNLFFSTIHSNTPSLHGEQVPNPQQCSEVYLVAVSVTTKPKEEGENGSQVPPGPPNAMPPQSEMPPQSGMPPFNAMPPLQAAASTLYFSSAFVGLLIVPVMLLML